jgi:hypothetical protein
MAVSSRTEDALRLWQGIPAEGRPLHKHESNHYSPSWRFNTT